MKNLLIAILLISTQAFAQNDFMGVNVFRDTVKFTKQVQYESNLSSTFNTRSLVDKGYVDSVSALGGGTPTLQQVFNTETGGSVLTKHDTIQIGDHTLRYIGNYGGPIINVQNSGLGAAIYAQNTAAGGGIALQGISSEYRALDVTSDPANANSVFTVANFNRTTSGTAADGIAGRINVYLENSANGTLPALQLTTTLVSATAASETSNIDLSGYNGGAVQKFMNIQPNGIVRVNDNTDTLATKADLRSGTARTLSSQYTDVSNSSTTETDLMSYSVPGGTLANDGDYIEFDAVFSYAANANGKTLSFKFGTSTHTYTAGSVTSSGGDVIIHGKIIRTSATTQRGFITFEPMFGTKSYAYHTATETLSGAVTLKFTGTSDTASDDITQKLMTVTYYPAN